MVSRPNRSLTDLFYHFILAVNLGALQAIGVVDVERLPLGIEIQSRVARFAMPVPRLLRSPERQMNLRADGGSVYVNNARVQVAHRLERAVHVMSIDRGGKTVAHAIGNLDCLIEPIDRYHRHHGTKNLLLRDA